MITAVADSICQILSGERGDFATHQGVIADECRRGAQAQSRCNLTARSTASDRDAAPSFW